MCSHSMMLTMLGHMCFSLQAGLLGGAEVVLSKSGQSQLHQVTF